MSRQTAQTLIWLLFQKKYDQGLLFAILSSILWIPALKSNILFEHWGSVQNSTIFYIQETLIWEQTE